MRRLIALALGVLLLAAADAQSPPGWRSIAVPVSESDYRCPVQPGGVISQGNFGSFSHQGAFAWDYVLPMGTPIVAARSGLVVKVRTDSNIGAADRRFENDANEVRVKHSDGTVAFYYHLAKNASLVREGEFVLQGETVALSGHTGFSTTPHLHYEVFRDGKSTRSTFSDFAKNGGIPREGDRHGPPAPPKVPQKTILAYKRAFRAAVVAELRGWHDLGLALLEDVPVLKSAETYHYARVIAAQREAFRASVDAEVARLTQSPPTVFVNALRIKLWLVTLKDVGALRPAREKLQAMESAFPPELARAFQGSGSAVAALAEGMRLECLEDIYEAGGRYGAAREAGRGELREEALGHVKRLIDLHLDRSVQELARLKDEAERGLPEHLPVIRTDAERVVRLCRSLFQYLRDWFPDKKEQAERDLKIVNYFWERIARLAK